MSRGSSKSTAIKLTDLLATLAGCPKGQSTNIDDRCKADCERRTQLNSEPSEGCGAVFRVLRSFQRFRIGHVRPA
jgi:hypothetical protein